MFSRLIMVGIWGCVAGSALILGAVFGYYFQLPKRLIATIMAFGAGVLMSAVSFELLNEDYTLGGAPHLVAGFIIGALIFTITNLYLARKGAKHRNDQLNLRNTKMLMVPWPLPQVRLLMESRSQLPLV
ncbi:hypothetical protein [Methanobacterium sp. BAmetb5]|uniref:hypothetical protein n=1 Tax=Methanobacterium sp. BAmetb5 TaxID=2025351 RepID=UPI0025FF9FD7|nr:hypothetical protein [Methanobacterium sp. BAmetb5]